jgi:uncharacterized protein YjbI with pentapeptide repeats
VTLRSTNKQKKEIDTSVSNNSALPSSAIKRKIITDEPSKDAPDFRSYASQLAEFIVNSNPRFTVGIYGGWGTGKTTLMEMIRNELKQKYSDNVETVWFDSWRYEREEFSAMVPLLRTIILSIEDRLEKIRNSGGEDKKRQVLSNLKDAFTKVGSAIIRNTTPNIGLKAGEVIDAGATLDIGKIIDDYKSDGSFIKGQERIYFHKHISEHLDEELQKIRYGKAGKEKGNVVYDFRIVIFVDDLDRCTPERALELLESIKTFFDIEGIIYVLGMDPSTIDPIIKTKYGEYSKIDGMNYLQKIVQLPFQIPVWSVTDLSGSAKHIMLKTGMPESEVEQILSETNIELITIASQLNPRDIKRFINTIILARYIYEHSIRDIEKLIAIQAFYFRSKDWLGFLKLITLYKVRIDFLKYFIMLLDRKGKDVSTIEDLNKLINDIIDKKQNFILDSPKLLLEIFKKFIQINDDDLFAFLKKAAVTLLKIENMERYLRATEVTGISNITENITERSLNVSKVDSEKLLELLKAQNIKEFNECRTLTSLLHFPCENFCSLNLSKINLSRAFLFYTNFSEADLSEADLSEADLTGADFRGAKLRGTNLTATRLPGALFGSAESGDSQTESDHINTDLRRAKLNKANLTGADLSDANLTGADLSDANLTGADLAYSKLVKAAMFNATLSGSSLVSVDAENAGLIEADLREADLRRGFFGGAQFMSSNLHKAFLFEANLSDADLSHTNLSGADLSHTNLSGADLSHTNLSGANLSGSILQAGILMDVDFSDLNVIDTIFEDAVITDPDFIDYLQKNNAKNIPKLVKDRDELRRVLELNKKLDKNRIDSILYTSRSAFK